MPSPYNPEREQIQDRKAGLKRKLSTPLSLCDTSPVSGGGKLMANAITHFLPLRQGESRRGGGMMKRKTENEKRKERKGNEKGER